MLPNSRIFRSRWQALLWAGGILWFAVDVAGVGGGHPHDKGAAAPTDATGTPVDDSDTRNAVGALDAVKD